ncbi:MAG: asparagine synthase-related protein, partial [Hyphomicrobiales bacterium]
YHRLVPEWLHNHVVQPLADALPFGARRIKTLAMVAGIRDFELRMQTWFGAMNASRRDDMYSGPRSRRTPDTFDYSFDPHQTALARVLFFDQTSWLPDNLLERGDRMMMAASIEGRMPFVDARLAAVISSIPHRHLRRGTTGKIVLRTIMRDILPKQILHRRKMGFRVPVGEWFGASLKSFVFDQLAASNSPLNSYLDKKAITTLLAEHAKGRQNHEKIIWTLLNLALFHQTFNDIQIGDT